MEKSINVRITEARAILLRTVIDFQLPAAILQLVLNEVKQIIDAEANQIIQNETMEYNKNIEEER